MASGRLLGAVLRMVDRKISAEESRHDTVRDAVCQTMREAQAGLYCAQEASEALRERFVTALADEPGRHPASEWAGILAWAVAQAGTDDPAARRRSVDERCSGLHVGDAEPVGLDELHRVYRRWLGADYDLDAIDAVVCALAARLLPGDPLWLLIVSGSGNAKTETVQAAAGVGGLVTSTIASEGALLSATSKRDTTSGAHGGLLRRLGPGGVLVIKDVTSILSIDRNMRASVLAALREVHDGRWERNVGTDGGRSLTWTGRLAVLGAVTDRVAEHLANPDDLAFVMTDDERAGLWNEDGSLDEGTLAAAIDRVLKERPHWKKPPQQRGGMDIGTGNRPGGRSHVARSASWADVLSGNME